MNYLRFLGEGSLGSVGVGEEIRVARRARPQAEPGGVGTRLSISYIIIIIILFVPILSSAKHSMYSASSQLTLGLLGLNQSWSSSCRLQYIQVQILYIRIP